MERKFMNKFDKKVKERQIRSEYTEPNVNIKSHLKSLHKWIGISVYINKCQIIKINITNAKNKM